MGVMAKGCGIYFWGNKNVLKLVIVVVDVQFWEQTTNQKTIYIKRINLVLCELYLHKKYK